MFLDVFARVVHESDHMVVIERVERLPARAPYPNQMRSAQQPELMRHCGFAQTHERRQIADATFAMCERINKTDTGGITKESEHVGDRVDR